MLAFWAPSTGSDRESVNVHWTDIEQNSAQPLTLGSSACAAWLLPGRDVHFILALPCPGAQISCREGTFLGPWGEPLDPLGPQSVYPWQSNNNMNNILQLNEHLPAKCLTNWGEKGWEACGFWKAPPSSLHLAAWLDRDVSLTEEGRIQHRCRTSGWELWPSIPQRLQKGGWPWDPGSGRGIFLPCSSRPKTVGKPDRVQGRPAPRWRVSQGLLPTFVCHSAFRSNVFHISNKMKRQGSVCICVCVCHVSFLFSWFVCFLMTKCLFFLEMSVLIDGR